MFDSSSSAFTDHGLRLRCAWILLNTWRAPIGQTTWVRIHGQDWFRLYRQKSNVLNPKPDIGEDEEVSHTLVLLIKNSIVESFSSGNPENSVTCILASIYDVDEDNDIIYANTEDTAFLIRAVGLNQSQKVDELVERVAEFSELLLAPPDTSQVGSSPSHTPQANATNRQILDDISSPADIVESAQPAAVSERVERASTREELSVRMRSPLSANEDFRTGRVRARDEGGQLSHSLR